MKKHELNLIFRACWVSLWNTISVDELSSHHHLNVQKNGFPNLFGPWNAAGFPEPPAEEPWLNRYHSTEITAFVSWYINNLWGKKRGSGETLAKWNNTYTQNTGTSGNKFHKKNRLQSTFFFAQIHCFPTSLPFLNYSQVIFEMGFGLVNHTASWKMFLAPLPNNSSFDWCKTKQKQKTPKWTSDLGEWGSLFVRTLQPTGDSELWVLSSSVFL